MTTFRATLLAVLISFAAFAAAADQSDSRLTSLFERLMKAQDLSEAFGLESEIWMVWLEHDDEAVRLLLDKGVEAMNRGDHRSALEDFDQIVAIAPDFAEGWNKRATVHFLLGHYPESLDDIAETLAREPRHFGALSGRGLVYSELEELELALESFEAALAVHPNMIGPRRNAEALRKHLEDQEI